MRSSNEMRVDDLRSRVVSLPTDLTGGYKTAAHKRFQTPKVSVEWLVSIELSNGGRMVYSNEETKAKAEAEAAELRAKGWPVSTRTRMRPTPGEASPPRVASPSFASGTSSMRRWRASGSASSAAPRRASGSTDPAQEAT